MHYDLLKATKTGFADGDDTGLAIVERFKHQDIGLKCVGFKPSRCPQSKTDFDPELNRYVGVVYGDKVYHHGGYTRITQDGDAQWLFQSFGWVIERVLDEGGAEWLLDDEVSHRYTFDREDEVFADKMKRTFGLRVSER